MYNWVFDLETGEAQGADEGSLRVWETRIENGRVLLTRDVLGELRASA
jgi:nitrite reductase (NADH) small subunit